MVSESAGGPDAKSPAVRMHELHDDGQWLTRMLSVVADLGVADELVDGARHVDRIAERTGSHSGALYRVLRALAGKGVFAEVAPREFGLTPMARTLCTDSPDSLRNFFRAAGAPALQQAYSALAYSVRTGKPSFEEVHGTDLFSYGIANPEFGRLFNDCMGNLARQVQSAAVEEYDLSGVRKLVDIGGGHGHLVSTILSRYPGMAGVVFDLPDVVPGAEEVLANAGVRDRAELAGGDYHVSVPAGGDAYVLSHVSHQINDTDLVTVLTNIRQAILPGGRVIIIDPVIPEGDAPHPGKFMDLIMLTLTPGRDRTEREFRELFAEAGLRFVETVAISSPSSVIVAAPG